MSEEYTQNIEVDFQVNFIIDQLPNKGSADFGIDFKVYKRIQKWCDAIL